MRGPILWSSIQRASGPGKTLFVFMMLCVLFDMERSKKVRITTARRSQFGLDRHALARSLHWLEAAGIVVVQRHRGRCPSVEWAKEQEPEGISHKSGTGREPQDTSRVSQVTLNVERTAELFDS